MGKGRKVLTILLVPMCVGIVLLAMTPNETYLCGDLGEEDIVTKDGCGPDAKDPGAFLDAPTFCRSTKDPAFCKDVTAVRFHLFVAGLVFLSFGCCFCCCGYILYGNCKLPKRQEETRLINQ